jgi:putative DNA primase/helicase
MNAITAHLARLEALSASPSRPVMLVHGNTAAEAAQAFLRAWCVTTWAGDPELVDWKPLRGRDVVIWPDNADDSLQASMIIAVLLHGVASRVRVIDPTRQPEGWNARDAADAEWDADRVVSWCKANITEMAPTVVAALEPVPEPEPPEPPPPPPREPPQQRPGRPLIFAGTPMRTAELFHATLPEGGRILHWRGEFYSWDGCRYAVRDRVYVEQRLYRFMDGCDTHKIIDRKTGDYEIVQFNPTARTVGDVVHALRAVCYADLPEPQCWIVERDDDPPAHDIIAMQNGFLHASTRSLAPSTERLFTVNALDFSYASQAPEPTEWLTFLDSIWHDDPQSIESLAEMFGYLLTDDTSQQKMFMLIGPSRSGKGTILRVLESLIGQHNRVAPSLASLGTQFGLQPLIGKRLAIISDARLSGRADQQPIVENLLRISGEDSLTIDRKNIGAWSGKLPVRFVIASNELPSFTDASAALANRFVLFRFVESFLGREDQGLTNRLRAELPGILKWSLDGLARLRERGHLVMSSTADNLAADLLDSTSHVTLFARECCVMGADLSAPRGDLFAAWRLWCKDEGRDHPGTQMTFGKQINSAFPRLGRSQPRAGGTTSGTRMNLYTGIDLNPEWRERVQRYEAAQAYRVPAQGWND